MAPAAPVVALEPRAVTAAGAPVAVRVVGSSLVDASGRALRLRGVNRAGSEFACAQGWGLFDGPTDNTSIAAMTSWGVNAVRLPLNESCWLGINGVSTQYGGQSYQDAIAGFVQRLHAAGLAVVLDLHWNAPGTQKATGQQVMADADHAPAFWSSVATRFVGDPGVVFDLYNEPHDVSWQCWRNGCTTAEGWRTAGMQTLLDAVRATGARQPVLAGGLGWASDLSHWLAYRPTDPAGQLGASAHIYNFSQCNNETCWDGSIGQVAKMVPVLTGELGSNDCATGFINRYLDWADRHNVNYLGWTWNTWDCNSGPALISSYDGTPTQLGAALRARLLTAATPPTTQVYDFEQGSAPWAAETVGAKVAASADARSGTGSLQVTLPPTVASTAVLRLNDGGNALTPANGGLLSAWVKVPVDAPGSRWCASVQLQDSGWSWHGGTCTPLTPGSWTSISFRPTSTAWTAHKALGIQVLSTQTGTGPLQAYVDDVQQSN